jgi:hypothetical protein
MVGIQIGGRSFVDEGVERCLDTLQEKGGVNTLMSTVFGYSRGLLGRTPPGQPLPDHGGQEYDEVHGGSYTAVHPEYFANSVIKDIRAPELGDFDILADVIPAAKARGMETYGLFEDYYDPSLIPNFKLVSEVDVYGRMRTRACFNNPEARAFILSMVEDWFKSNDLDGLMWESERQGPINHVFGGHWGSVLGRMEVFCFCTHCVEKAHEQGIDVQRARDGYIALERFVRRTLSQGQAGDRTFIRIWRLLVEYPEIMAWHKLWYRSQEEMYALIYGTAKSINPQAQVGWHIMQYVTVSTFYGADTDYGRLARFADFIKPSTYNNCAGPRFARYVRNMQSTIFRDFTPEQVLELHYAMLGLEGEASLDQLPTVGFTAGYVETETRRAVADVQGEIPIYPGIDIDIATELDEKRTQPEDVKAATLAAFEGGASGIVLSRKYAEMWLTNMEGAKEALAELGFL